MGESGGTIVKMKKEQKLFSKDFQNFDYFRNGSFKIKNISKVVCTHPLQSIALISTLPEFHQGIRIISASVCTEVNN